ncbi:MAG: hypothetical protein HPY45_14345 [Anaerolineae bacterium]|nr:hypothetical protein [Anaerolineae bacterium]
MSVIINALVIPIYKGHLINLWLVVLALLPVIVIFLLLTLLAFVFLKPSRAHN